MKLIRVVEKESDLVDKVIINEESCADTTIPINRVMTIGVTNLETISDAAYLLCLFLFIFSSSLFRPSL